MQKIRDSKKPAFAGFLGIVAEWTGLEPATSGVTGQHSNRLNYRSAKARNYTRGRASAASAAMMSPIESGEGAQLVPRSVVGAEGIEPPTLSV